MKGVVRIAAFALLLPISLSGKPAYHLYRNRSEQGYRPVTQNPVNPVQGQLSNLQNDVGNHEIELRMLEERLNTQESILDALRQQFLNTTAANKEMFKGSNHSLEQRVEKMEIGEAAVAKDIRGLQSHSNDTAKALSQYKQKIVELEQELKATRESVNAIFSALQIEEPLKTDTQSHLTYKVKAGDRLEKIARAHKTTIKKIKDLNHLKSDKIVIGQTLKIP